MEEGKEEEGTSREKRRKKEPAENSHVNSEDHRYRGVEETDGVLPRALKENHLCPHLGLRLLGSRTGLRHIPAMAPHTTHVNTVAVAYAVSRRVLAL